MPYQLLTAQTQFTLQGVQTSKRGQKFAPIVSPAPLWQLTSIDAPLFCPFGANVYKGDGTETRLNLDCRLDDHNKELFTKLDEYFEKLIGPQKSTYHPMVHDDGEYGTRLRIKVSTVGAGAGILWSPTKERLGTVKDFETRGAYLVPVVGFSRVWYMGGLHGVTLELKHAIVTQAPQEADFDWPTNENPSHDPPF